MHKILEDLQWRYATKRFDSTLKIGDTEIEIIREALRLTPTSYGLQAMKFLFVESPELRNKLMEATYGQRAISEASHLLVLCTENSVRPELIDEYIEKSSAARNADPSKASGYRDFLKNSLTTLPEKEAIEWNARQVYISLGILLSVCARLRIDMLPMEGFQEDRYDEILGLKSRNLSAVLVCPLGYRHAEDQHQHYPKVRRSEDDLFENH